MQSCRRTPSVWTFNRATEWWDVIVPGFNTTQWVQNFRMSKETIIYLCNKLRPMMESQDTSFRVCVPLQKRLAIALWKLATGSEYRTVGHLFGVSTTTVCQCVQEFCAAAKHCWHQSKYVSLTRESLKRWLPTMRTDGGSRCVLVLLMVLIYPSWHHRSTTATISTGKAGTPSFHPSKC